MSELISIRLTEDINKKLKKLAEEEGEDKSTLIRELILKGYEEKQLENALELYKKGNVTMWKAAQLASISLWKIIEIIKERKIELNYSEENLKEDLEPLLRKRK